MLNRPPRAIDLLEHSSAHHMYTCGARPSYVKSEIYAWMGVRVSERASERARVSRELRTETVQSLETEIFPLTSCSMVLSLPENVGHSARAELTKARAVKTSAETTRRDHILQLGKIFSLVFLYDDIRV